MLRKTELEKLTFQVFTSHFAWNYSEHCIASLEDLTILLRGMPDTNVSLSIKILLGLIFCESIFNVLHTWDLLNGRNLTLFIPASFSFLRQWVLDDSLSYHKM